MNNPECRRRGGSCRLEVHAVLDAIYDPSLERYGFLQRTLCIDHGLCSYASLDTSEWADVYGALWAARPDDSRVQYHQALGNGSEWRCVDRNHVVDHGVLVNEDLFAGASTARSTACGT